LNSNNGIKFIFLSNLLELLQFYKCLDSIGIIHIKSLEKMKVHYAPRAKVCPISSPAQHMGWLGLGWQPTAKKQGALADGTGRWRPVDSVDGGR
jgi:hypothetical protein